MKKYKILAVTLARGGSRSIKKKNLALINGKPLIYYTIKEALKSKLITRYIVSTDACLNIQTVNRCVKLKRLPKR